MKKSTTISFLILSMVVFSQNSKSLEGYYNLSEFEMAARLYLLDNNTFYYSAIFGSVDLEIYGTYAIEENALYFHPQEDQMQTFILYGRENKNLKGEIAFNYYKPEDSYQNQVVFGLDQQWVKRPLEQADNKGIEFTIKKQEVAAIKIGYPTYFDKVGRFFQVSNVVQAEVPTADNDFLLSYNRYASMRKQFSENPIQLKGDALINGKKTRQRKPLKERDKEKMKTFFKENKMFASTTESRGKVFQQIPLTIENSKPKLKVNKSGQLEEMLTYTQSGDTDENGNYYYDNKKLKEIITYKNEVKIGARKWYYENGQLEETGKYKDGLQEGKWKRYYADGQQSGISNYSKGERQGEWKTFFPNRQLEEIGLFAADKKEGVWKIYYDNGKPKEIENYKNGEKAGICKAYYENGQLKRVSEYKGYTTIGHYEYYQENGHLSEKGDFNEKGNKTGEWKFYSYESGKLRTIGTYLNGKSIGEHKSFYEDGTLEGKVVYKNEGEDATHISYYKNGKIKEKREVKNGEYAGEMTAYYENGQLKSKHFYDLNGKSTGESKSYFENGKLSSISNYKNGNHEGEEKQYSDSGQLLEIGNYKNGNKIGVWKYYHENGQLKRVGDKSKFNKIGEWKYYHENGQLRRGGTYNEHERKIGEWVAYYKNGKLLEKTNYNDNGEIIGETKNYHDNGQLSGVAYRDDTGKNTGEWKKYSKSGELLSTATFKDNKIIGDWKYYPKKYTTYYDNGEIKESGAKLNGGFFGEQKHYFESGKLAGLHFYDNFGRANGEWKQYHENGQIKTIRLWRYSELKEVISCFDSNGAALDKGTFKDGNGTVNEYDAKGVLIVVDYLYGKEINWNDSSQLNSLAWKVYEREEDKEKLEKAIEMVKRSITLDKTYYNTDTYAALLYKTGNYKQAIVLAKQAIEIAKKDEIDFKATEQLIEEINKND